MITKAGETAANRTADSAGRDHLKSALEYLARVQDQSGYWEAEMVWNTMLLSQWVITQRICGQLDSISETTRNRILKHYEVTRTPEGGWAMHGEGGPYVFMTSLAYVALRLLGVPSENPLCARALTWLKQQPHGVLAVPSWGKFWLAMIGLYEYSGVNPIPPELFLLPDELPIQPNNFYCHTRYIYLGIAYLYGKRFRANLGAITNELRRELYDREYQEIDFSQYRHLIAQSDLYVRPSLPLRAAWDLLAAYEKFPSRKLRQKALSTCFTRIVYEQEVTRGQGLSPVNGLLNCLALHSESHPLRDSSLQAMESWKWEDDAEGIRYCGAHSTSWDTAFALRALLEAPEELTRSPAAATALARGYEWLRDAQMQEELPDHVQQRREPILGGWCFSDGKHRWAVSDCTAEAITALMLADAERAERPDGVEPISDERLAQAARFILRRQNDDGGFGSYEKRRGSQLLEWVNPSEMYGNCMTERSYTECTASCVGALARFRQRFPGDRRDAAPSGREEGSPSLMRAEIDGAIARGVKLLRSRQREDGSYAGFWGVNFTYGIFHVVEALRAAGVPASDPAIARAADWLLEHQKADGGWGEHWKSCLTDEYVEHPESQAAMTAWALLALMEALPTAHPAIVRGVQKLRALQLPDGKWPQQAQSGIFFSTAMLDYRLYKDYFPTWALARHQHLSRQ